MIKYNLYFITFSLKSQDPLSLQRNHQHSQLSYGINWINIFFPTDGTNFKLGTGVSNKGA